MAELRLPAGVDDYPAGDARDEGIAAPGAPRGLYAEVMAALADQDLVGLARGIQSEAAARGINFGDGSPIGVDPVPRLIGGAEWERLEAGLVQRVRALNAFLLDAYGEQQIFAAGKVPWRLLETSPGYEPRLRGLLDPGVPPATVAGPDIVRDPAGTLLVLEDNLRMPSGSAYVAALRELVSEALPTALERRPLGSFATTLGEAIRSAAPSGDAAIAILSDGPRSGAWFEHQALGAALGAVVVVPGELELAAGELFARDGSGRRRIDVVYRRLDDERLSDERGEPTPLGELLLPAIESGRLRVLNAFGSGLADDKLAHSYVETMVGFYLGEEPLLHSVPSIDLSEIGARAEAIGRIDELVIKPRDGFGGRGVTIVSRAGAEERDAIIAAIEREPEAFVAQEALSISTHPTICAGRLRPRRIDLRPFVVSGRDHCSAMPGGLTRFARGAGELVVNSSRGGGCKDTWVVGP
ncbi:MAG TPA: circularly permuted type 2 ATP-grasp protein [Solirubrobacterales bacterium]